MPFTLPPLPFQPEQLARFTSVRTFELHHGKHHRAYVDNLNRLVEQTPMSVLSLESLIEYAGQAGLESILNNAAQSWSHTFFWNSLSPEGGGEPTGRLARLIERDFNGYTGFRKRFKESSISLFGSGWTWLVMDQGRLDIRSTSNAELPNSQHVQPLITLDVWEHAYYVDFENRRADYVDGFLDLALNWKFAESLLPENQ